MKTLYKQCNLSSGDSVMTAWLEADKVKVGYRVTLKNSEDPKLWWTIDSISEISLPREEIKGAHASDEWYKNDFRGTLKGLNIK